MTAPGPPTDQDEVVAEFIFNLINDNKETLGVEDVLYGNHVMIPRSSAAVVTAMGHNRALAGVAAPGGVTMNTLIVMIDLHWSKVGDESTQRREADAKGTILERKIHADTTCGGLIIHGFINQVDRGETVFNGSMFRTVRMLFNGTTKTYLSPPAAP